MSPQFLQERKRLRRRLTLVHPQRNEFASRIDRVQHGLLVMMATDGGNGEYASIEQMLDGRSKQRLVVRAGGVRSDTCEQGPERDDGSVQWSTHESLTYRGREFGRNHVQ